MWRAIWTRPSRRWTWPSRWKPAPATRRRRGASASAINPPDILLTTPEQLSLLLAHPRSAQMFESLKTVVLDELHALYNSKRGDLLALGLARLQTLAPAHRRVGLSATVKDPAPLQRFLMPQPPSGEALSALVIAKGGARPQIDISASDSYVPWAGHLARHAMADVMAAIQAAKTALVFVNTRSQAERTFQELWRSTTHNLPIALHHGSLSPEQRRKVEAAMAKGSLRAVVCTSTLDLGIDWGAVDRVICIGAPKGAARLVQRIGRANHRLDEPSAALLVPANRFEVLECNAARDAVLAGELDGERLKTGALDVLAQHVLGTACAAPFDADGPVRRSAQRLALSPADAARISTRWSISSPPAAMRCAPMTAMRGCAKPKTGACGWRIRGWRRNTGSMSVSSWKTRWWRSGCKARGVPPARAAASWASWRNISSNSLSPGDTFVFAGEVLRFEGLREDGAYVTQTKDPQAEIPSYNGGKFPLSTFLAQRVREMVSAPAKLAGVAGAGAGMAARSRNGAA